MALGAKFREGPIHPIQTVGSVAVPAGLVGLVGLGSKGKRGDRVSDLVAGLSVNTRGGGDFGSGILTCNVARAVSRRDVLAAVCFMAPAAVCCMAPAAVVQFASAKSLPPEESLPPNRFRWNMFQNRFRQRNLEHSDPW